MPKVGSPVAQGAARRILVPSKGPEAWQPLLAKPKVQWKVGASARTLAHSWEHEGDLPLEIRRALESTFEDVELLLAVPEWRVPLRGGSTPSQSDVWALCGTASGLASVAVEGKVDEPFGPTVGTWLRDASPGKQERLAHLSGLLGLAPPSLASVRYQFLHRTASALLEAERFRAAHAAMVVQSFHPDDAHFDDFLTFAKALGTSPLKGQLAPVPGRGPITLHIGWVQGDRTFLRA